MFRFLSFAFSSSPLAAERRLRNALALIVLVAACGDDSAAMDAAMDTGVPMDGASPRDLSVRDGEPDLGQPPDDLGVADRGADFDATLPPVDAGPLPDFPADWPRSRAWQWVRTNEPFITALSVRMGDGAPAEDVRRYFDDFGATAVHLWEWGLPTSINGWLEARPGARWFTWVNRDGNGQNGMLLGGGPRPAGLIGYQIGDEPRDRASFNAVLEGFRRVAAEDPGPLRVFNYTFEAPEVDAFLVETCEAGTADVFSYDHYSLGNRQFTNMMKFRNAAIACGIPYWRYLKGFVSAADDGEFQSLSDLRWDAFTGLLTGYTGHTWFLYNVRGGVAEGIPTTFFNETENWGAEITARFRNAARVNRELLIYSRAQTRLRSTGVGWWTPNEIPSNHPPVGFPAWRAGAGGDPFLRNVRAEGNELPGIGEYQDVLLGFFDDRFGDHYVMLVNPNHTGGSFPTNTENNAEVILDFDFAGSDASSERLRVLRPDGTVVAAPIVAGSARFTIAPGDLVFFKYDTGRGFEGYR